MRTLKDFFVMALKLDLALIIVLLLGFQLAWGVLAFEVAGAMLLNLIPGAGFSFIWGLPVAAVVVIFVVSRDSQTTVASVSTSKEEKAGELTITLGRWTALTEFCLAQILCQGFLLAFRHPALSAAQADDLLTFNYINVILTGFMLWFIFMFLHLIILLLIKGRHLRSSAA